MHDVYAYGVIAPSTLIELGDEFPSPGGYAEIANVFPSIGGEAAGSAYVLARLGVPTKLQGNRLSDDASSMRVLATLSDAGVDCSAVTVDAATAPIAEVVIAHGAERTVMGTYGRLLADRAWDEPSKDDIRTSRVVCVDPFFGDESKLVGRWCRETGTPYVTVDAAPDTDLVEYAAALIISEEFAARTVESDDPREVLAAYTRTCRGLVVLTRGSRTLWCGRRSEPSREYRPFAVDVRDTTGAGDSFRAGFIYGMLQGHAEDRLVRTAGAVAALVCQRPPGVLNSPTEEELIEFMTTPGSN